MWVALLCPAALEAGDWPQWRYDAGRGAVCPDELAAELHLQWTRQLPRPRPAWPESQPWLRFDESYSPVAAGKLLLVPSMVADRVTAYDTETGAERWRFYTDGPVRLAPIARDGRVYFGSDDGHLYCLDASDGRLLWKFRGAPSDRKVLGGRRLISTWPVRGGPVLLDGTIYFTAGIWPFMGIFAHAVDAETGRSVWTNSGFADTWAVQPHNSPAFGGLVPRGHLAATRRGLVVPGGRTEPGCFDLETGKFLGFSFGGKGAGSYHVMASRDWYFVTGTMRRIVDGTTVLSTKAAIHDEKAVYGIDGDRLFAQALEIDEQKTFRTDRKGKKILVIKPRLKDLWQCALPEAPGRLFLKAGSRFYAGKEGQVAAVAVDPDEGRATIPWKETIEGTPWTMLAADQRLFVVGMGGSIWCFGPKEVDVRVHSQAPAKPTARQARSIPASGSFHAADEILELGRGAEGYCVMFAPCAGAAARALAEQSKLHVLVIDPDQDAVNALRREMDDAGLYGTRIAAHVGQPAAFPLPPYLATLVYVDGSSWEKDAEAKGDSSAVAGSPGATGGSPRATGSSPGAMGSSSAVAEPRHQELVKAVFRALRPYGGTAVLPVDAKRLASLVEDVHLEGARVEAMGPGRARLVREGPLPGAADWTHQYADAANSVVSKDQRVKTPLGLLWFGGPPNDEVLPRHGHGPSPQVAGGRLVIEGANMLRALDIYTGRLLWQKDLPGLGTFYDNTNHQPGAGEIGSNYVSLEDCVYVVYDGAILELDAATGERKKDFKLEGGSKRERLDFGFLAAYEDLLVATSTPVQVSKAAGWLSTLRGAVGGQRGAKTPPVDLQRVLTPTRYSSGSRRLVVFNRRTGAKLWEREAEYGFRHNAIAVGGGKLFAIDGLSKAKRNALKRYGVKLDRYRPRLLALDVTSGEEIWSTRRDVVGTFLNYSDEHDVLLQAGSASRDRAADESDTGMVAYSGQSGSVLWRKALRHAGPCMLYHDTIITQGPAYSLLTGEPKLRQHPLTGEPMPWRFTRNYGCNTAIASEHLITFRSAAAGYFDLASDGGTGNLGGFKSGCTSNLIVAGGLLNAPEYTRTCECSYQNQTSLALVHDPDAETWTFNPFAWDGKPVRRVGLNFGAPGDRRAPNGTLWLDYPSVGGPSPDIPVDLEIQSPEWFRRHSLGIQADPAAGALNWVAASGVEGAGRIILTLAKPKPTVARKYTVRLHFAEVDGAEPRERVFDVRLQDEEVLTGVDISKEAGLMTAVMREFTGVEVTDQLVVSLVPQGDKQSAKPLLCGIEIVAEGW